MMESLNKKFKTQMHSVIEGMQAKSSADRNKKLQAFFKGKIELNQTQMIERDFKDFDDLVKITQQSELFKDS